MTRLALTINGRAVRTDVPARMSLADFLRDRQDLTGTHLACEHGVCGACTVLLDDEPIRACLSLAVACAGRAVTTIEGFAGDTIMSSLRQAFWEQHGLQCGYCTPAMLITARDLIRRGKCGSAADIRKGIAGNLCRCTGYTNIVQAIDAAARAVAADDPRVQGASP